ncbi:Uncharacterised protein [Escherichia coli]|uniref:Uncharacterized protein n=1 Tax=Escherichia coli TaxID=562 RepID=A0A377E199_ECOLX|nr:Uncharacterised protein [Escherichia coli]
MLRGLGGAVAALAQQPVGRTQSQRGASQRGYLCGARVGVEDHELAGECDQRDQDHRLDLDDAVPTQRPRARWNA